MAATETVKAAQDAHLEQLATKADIGPPRRRPEACQVDARHCHCRHRHPLAQKPAGVNTPMSEAAPRTSPRKVGAKMGRGFLIRRPDPLPPVAPPSALPHLRPCPTAFFFHPTLRFFLPLHPLPEHHSLSKPVVVISFRGTGSGYISTITTQHLAITANVVDATSTRPQFKLGQSHPKNTIIPCK